MDWTVTAFNLLQGNPFDYRPQDAIGGTQAFVTGIRKRDGGRCVVCGIRLRRGVECCHIIPKSDSKTVRHSLSFLRYCQCELMTVLQWETMRANGFVPPQAKSVEHEPRNGIQLCKNHHSLFDDFSFFIRWIPTVFFYFEDMHTARLIFLPPPCRHNVLC